MKTIKTRSHIDTVVIKPPVRQQEARKKRLAGNIGLLIWYGERHNGQIDGTAPRMARFFCNIVVPEKVTFVDSRIKLPLRFDIFNILRPSYKMINGALGPVTVVDLQGQCPCLQFVLDFCQGLGGLPRYQTVRRPIAVNLLADKVVGTKISHIKRNIGDDVPDVYEIPRPPAL